MNVNKTISYLPKQHYKCSFLGHEETEKLITTYYDFESVALQYCTTYMTEDSPFWHDNCTIISISNIDTKEQHQFIITRMVKEWMFVVEQND